MWKRNFGTSSHRIFCVRTRNFKSHNIMRVEYLWFLMQWPECHESAGATGPWVKAILKVLFFTLPSWRWPLLGFFCVFSPLLWSVTTQLTYGKDPDIRQTSWPKAAGARLSIGSTHQSKGEFSTLLEGSRIGPRSISRRVPAGAQWPCQEHCESPGF